MAATTCSWAGVALDTVSYEHALAGVTVSLAVLAAQNTIGAGTDTLSGFENLTGSAFNDTLTGDANTNVLIGLAGNDILNGGAGADLMQGGLGNDTYVVDNVGDVVDETGGDGLDTVQSSVSFSLADPVHAMGAIENLTLTGSAVINGTGNDLDNVLLGNAANNVLIGLGGNDTLERRGRRRCDAGRVGQRHLRGRQRGRRGGRDGRRRPRHGAVVGELQSGRPAARHGGDRDPDPDRDCGHQRHRQ